MRKEFLPLGFPERLCKHPFANYPCGMPLRRKELDAPSLKALAHPLRVQILRLLELREQMSVTSLAAELGETTGAISYHLRQLARHGLVEEGDDAEEAPEQPDRRRAVGRRRRLWRMAVDE